MMTIKKCLAGLAVVSSALSLTACNIDYADPQPPVTVTPVAMPTGYPAGTGPHYGPPPVPAGGGGAHYGPPPAPLPPVTVTPGTIPSSGAGPHYGPPPVPSGGNPPHYGPPPAPKPAPAAVTTSLTPAPTPVDVAPTSTGLTATVSN